MEQKRIKCTECGRTRVHPMCCNTPLEFKGTSWVCKHCKKGKDLSCCDQQMVPQTEDDIDLPAEVVDQFEEQFEKEDKHHHSKDDRPDYIG